MQQLPKNSKASIIHLFQKMDSNITKFRASLSSSPSDQHPKGKKSNQQQPNCPCQQDNKCRRLERQFYLSQQESVSKVAQLFKDEGNQTWAKLLNFMSDYLVKIIALLGQHVICQCKQAKIDQYADFCHKIAFLREENHKFFKMIQEKTEECQQLRIRIEEFQEMKKTKCIETPIAVHFLPGSSNITSELTSMIASSNSSRISQFKHIWPQLTLPSGDFGHRRYFQESPGERCMSLSSRTVLANKQINHPLEGTFRKAKIFEHH